MDLLIWFLIKVFVVFQRLQGQDALTNETQSNHFLYIACPGQSLGG
jgi:hypothetical protein